MSFTFSRTILAGIVVMMFFVVIVAENASADDGHVVNDRNHLHCDGGLIVTEPSEGSDRPYSCDGVVIPDPDPVPEIVVGEEDPAPAPEPSPTPTPTNSAGPCNGIPGTVLVGGVCLPTEQALGIQDDPIEKILISITMFVTGLIGVVAVLMIVVSGVMYMLSAGDTARTETAKKILTYAIIGLVVALLAWVIVSVVSRVTGAGGLNASNPDGPVTGTMVEFCHDPGDRSTCILIQNNE